MSYEGAHEHEELQELARSLRRPPVEGFDRTVLEVFEPGEERKTWGRASIMVNTHPLHPSPRVRQADFLIPPGEYRLKLAGDSALFGLAMAGLAYFPLWMANIMAGGGITNWVWGSMLAVGAASAIALFLFASVADRKALEQLL